MIAYMQGNQAKHNNERSPRLFFLLFFSLITSQRVRSCLGVPAQNFPGNLTTHLPGCRLCVCGVYVPLRALRVLETSMIPFLLQEIWRALHTLPNHPLHSSIGWHHANIPTHRQIPLTGSHHVQLAKKKVQTKPFPFLSLPCSVCPCSGKVHT